MSEIRSQATPARDELAETLQGELFERGQQVGEWPDDEKELHRDPDQWTDFTDRANKVRKLRFEKAADALLAAGWSKPRTVNSATELDALPMFTVIRSEQGSAWERQYGALGKPLWIEATQTRGFPHTSDEITLPATVLFTPGEAG